MSEVYDLDRATNIENDIDAFGKKWEIKQERGRALYFTRPNPDREDAVIPKNMQGKWTKIELLRKEIRKHVVASHDQADAARAKAERKAQAAKEAAAKKAPAKKKVANDAGSKDN